MYNSDWDDWLDIDDLPPTMSKLRVVMDAEKPQDSIKAQRELVEGRQSVSSKDG